jgi:hypothetical protein
LRISIWSVLSLGALVLRISPVRSITMRPHH